MTPILWFPLLIFFLILGTVLNLPWVVFITTAALFILLGMQLWKRTALKQVYYRRKWIYTRGFPGEQTPFRIEVENRKPVPLSWLRTIDPFPLDAAPTDKSALAPYHLNAYVTLVNLYSLRWYQRITREYTILFRTRGIYPVGPVELEAGDFFGVYETSRQLNNEEYLTVFPELLSMPELAPITEDPFGTRRAPRRLFEDPNLPMGVRDYRPEDDLRRIHWNATARTGQLQVKVYQPVAARVLAICLNVSTSDYYWQGLQPELLEQLIKIGATLAYQGISSGYSVGLLSNGAMGRSDRAFRILPGRSQTHLAILLQALAGITPITTARFEDYLLKTMPELPLGAALLIITARVTDLLVETIFTLKRYRPQITLVSLDQSAPPAIPGIRIIHLPFQT